MEGSRERARLHGSMFANAAAHVRGGRRVPAPKSRRLYPPASSTVSVCLLSPGGVYKCMRIETCCTLPDVAGGASARAGVLASGICGAEIWINMALLRSAPPSNRMLRRSVCKRPCPSILDARHHARICNSHKAHSSPSSTGHAILSRFPHYTHIRMLPHHPASKLAKTPSPKAHAGKLSTQAQALQRPRASTPHHMLPRSDPPRLAAPNRPLRAAHARRASARSDVLVRAIADQCCKGTSR